MCVPWESNPQPFALLTQCSTTEPQEQILNFDFFCQFELNNSVEDAEVFKLINYFFLKVVN